MSKVLITTVPFGDKNRYPLDLLEEQGIDYVINPLGKKLTEEELVGLIPGYDALIAGTEPITKNVMNASNGQLKLISRVGIGLDSVDLMEAEKKNIAVSYTPDAPAPAVVELTMGLMYSLLRHVHESNVQMHRGEWHRYFGKRLVNCKIGLVGLGRIGSGVLKNLLALGCQDILCNDITVKAPEDTHVRMVSKEEIYKSCDVISLHLPLTAQTKNMITAEHIGQMQPDAVLINTSRGGIINEKDLYDALKAGRLAAAAIDVFEQEPYDGSLAELDNCLITAHMGSMSIDCRTQMEIEATEEAVRFLVKGVQEGAVPADEYDVQRQGL